MIIYIIINLQSLLRIYDSIFDGKNEPGFKQLMEVSKSCILA